MLADLLDGVRARGALFNQTALRPPWSLRFELGVELTLATMIRGDAWVIGDDRPAAIREGDIAIVKGAYTIADDPRTPPQYLVKDTDYCIDECVLPEGPSLLFSGAYQGSISERLLDALPRVAVVRSGTAMLDMIAGEMTRSRPGQRVVLDRMLDLLLVETLRTWFDQNEAPVWYRTSDPLVGDALRIMHDDPAHPWTVASLAAKIGTSRAALARRFTAQVGQPPIAYLTSWRIALAADLLRDTDATVASIARRVGYANAFALSAAFKRVRGTTPSGMRVAHSPS
ncbi:AraC family transcriptional regulator [Kibdelosporangium persicum]|uniref:RCS-specific HTH-type transcriptional activator RclR n=2 Tax=Kibdelosporangium persicum TaxID=2698649 RepID=A0ABX2F1W4_9PSEU|nr:AraC family transcriptional regulator [Kibdelosporangium persicum]NRN64981.1 RCS-specific HTH-type transcriptional activator RclR [Kibdelosporangium persicum]